MKKSRDEYIEVQKGPVSVEQQYNLAFDREPEKTLLDMEHLEMRRSGMTLTKHEPKR